MKPEQLVGRELKAVWVAPLEVHPAWRDSSTPALASGFANLDLAEMQTVTVQPCEVEYVQNKYPSLGIELLSVDRSPTVHYWSSGGGVKAALCPEIQQFLPSYVVSTSMWDSLGEGPTSAIRLVLLNGRTLVLRHIYPPMTLGIEFEVGK